MPEVLVVVAIIVILAAITLHLAGRFSNKNKERKTRQAISILNAALQEFEDFDYSYSTEPDPNFVGYEYPIDCNGFTKTEVINAVEEALNPDTITDTNMATYDIDYSGISVAYFFLDQVPSCGEILERLDEELVTNENADGESMMLEINNREYRFYRVNDAWGRPLRYDYYDEEESDGDIRFEDRRQFPKIKSAGKDGEFSADDVGDITAD